MESPETLMTLAGSGFFAGPSWTLPSSANLLPWHGQMMLPSAISDTVQPWCVQIADIPLNVPAAGWVMTVSPTITPEPTGTADVFTSALPKSVDGGWPAAPEVEGPADGEGAGGLP